MAGTRTLGSPDRIDQRVARHGPIGVQHQEGKQSQLTPSAQVQATLLGPNLNRPQDPNTHHNPQIPKQDANSPTDPVQSPAHSARGHANPSDQPRQLVVIACDRAVTARTNPCTARHPPMKGPRCTPSSKPNSRASSHVKKRSRLRPDLQHQSHPTGSGSHQAASEACAQGAGSSCEARDGLEKPTANLANNAADSRRANGYRRTASRAPQPAGAPAQTATRSQGRRDPRPAEPTAMSRPRISRPRTAHHQPVRSPP